MPKSDGSDSSTGPRWTLLDRDELVDAYWAEVAPALRAEGRDPQTDRPSYAWLSANGYRGLVYALREYHDTTFAEFWKGDLGLKPEGYDWGIDHDPTISALERYLDRQRQRLSWTDSTVQTHRYRLARYVRAYAGVNGTDDVLKPVSPDSELTPGEAVDMCWDTFDSLDRSVGRTTLQRIYRTTSDWYDTLVARREAELNPTNGLEYDWSDGDTADDAPSNPALEPDHVRAMYDAAADTREQLLVVALCAWGLRTSEVAALHSKQLHLDSETPHVRFDERKNGPGTVAVIYGVDIARDRLAEFADIDGWKGYLFPSARSETGHRTRGTIGNWFEELVERAGISDIDGEKPVPQMARRFWYDRYSDTVEALVEHQIAEIAAEQGSASADVVWKDYLSEERRRELRREFMREELGDAFDEAV